MDKACSAAGLDVDKGQGLVPKVHTYGKTEDGSKAYLCTDYLDFSGSLSSSAQKTLGKKLALMHSHGTSPNGKFGFDVPTHCGDTEQDNTWTDSWSEFWANRRIGEMVKRINSSYGGDSKLSELEKEMREHVYPLLLDTLKDVKPAILHGDLWSGNAGQASKTGEPVIFDPSSYYGHNEAELGIMKMFGGFGGAFTEAYHAVLPKTEPVEYYSQRVDLYELYHHLNHAHLFGGGSYLSGAKRIMQNLIDWAKKEGNKGGRKAEL
jgi:fructosamine-3-kinase